MVSCKFTILSVEGLNVNQSTNIPLRLRIKGTINICQYFLVELVDFEEV